MLHPPLAHRICLIGTLRQPLLLRFWNAASVQVRREWIARLENGSTLVNIWNITLLDRNSLMVVSGHVHS